jgi:DNA-binding SARP family transcriptional activator
MSVEIRLMGRPGASSSGDEISLRGHKAWVLLALLLLEGAPVSRDRLARMLFIDAADPAAALRWNLSQLRQCLGVGLIGDPVALTIPDGVTVDVALLLDSDAEEAAAVPGLDEDLLAGVRAEAASDLAMWLEDERRHLRRVGLDIREEAALTRLGRGDADGALALARQVAEASPLDENASALLVRCLRAAGRITEARTTAEHAAARLRDELGVEPTAQLWSAVATPPGGDRRVTGRRAVTAQLDAGASAVDAGATDTGIAALRSAVVAARAVREPALLARALVALGSAMIHGVRGVDQEGLTLLHEAVPLTATTDDPTLAARARREIGYVDFLRGRYDRALHWFDQARRAGDDATTEIGWIDTYAGTSRDDVGDRPGAARLLTRALHVAQAQRDVRLEAYTLSILGRHHLMLGDLDEAQRALDAALQIAHTIGWTSFRPWPEALLADVIRHHGDLHRARAMAEQAFVLGEQIGDPCWEAAALRSLGLVTVDDGDLDRGVALLRDVPVLCRRLPDTYRWVELWGYDALVDVAKRHQLAQAPAWAEHLATEASALGMRPLAQRARSAHGSRAEPR